MKESEEAKGKKTTSGGRKPKELAKGVRVPWKKVLSFRS